MELGLPRGQDNALHFVKVQKQVLDDDGNPLGTPSKNSILNARKYEVKYLDGTTEVLAANAIAENMLAQVDEQGHRQLLLDEIVDHRFDQEAFAEEADVITGNNGAPKRVKTTKGCQLFVQWKGGSCN